VVEPADGDRAVFVGGPDVHDATIELAEPDARWAERFAGEARRIRRALGARVLGLEHVGSTAVPRLAAKPIIDIALTVADSSDEAAYGPPLEAAGYTLRVREPGWFQHRLLQDRAGGVNLHVFTAGCPEVDRMIRFRDHLRADDADRRLYETTKRELAARRWTYVDDYARAKSDVVAAIWRRIDAR
jgi:GrpB-like predicted nucleotidyltransferase (UPF0157 family)